MDKIIFSADGTMLTFENPEKSLSYEIARQDGGNGEELKVHEKPSGKGGAYAVTYHVQPGMYLFCPNEFPSFRFELQFSSKDKPTWVGIVHSMEQFRILDAFIKGKYFLPPLKSVAEYRTRQNIYSLVCGLTCLLPKRRENYLNAMLDSFKEFKQNNPNLIQTIQQGNNHG